MKKGPDGVVSSDSSHGTGSGVEAGEYTHREMVENSEWAFIYFDNDGVIRQANHKAAAYLGLERDQFVGKSLHDLLPAEQADKFWEVIRNRMHDLRGMVVEDRIRLPTGEYWFLSHGQTVRDAAGETIGIQYLVTDVSEYRVTEPTTVETDERYRDFLEGLGEMVFTVGADGRATYVSPALESLLGFEASDITENSFDRFIHPGDLERAARQFARCISGKTTTDEIRVVTGSGDVRWVRATARPVFDGDRVVGIRGLLLDMTERRLAEERIRESEEQHRLLIENTGSSIAYFDNHGRVLMANSRGAADFGMTPDQIAGRNIKDVFPGGQGEQIWMIMQNVLRDGKGILFERTADMPAGKRSYFTSIQPIKGGQGAPVGVQAIATDITDLRKAEHKVGQLQSLLTNIVNSMPSVLIGVDGVGRVTQWNREAERAIGVWAQRALGSSLNEAYPELARHLPDMDCIIESRQIRKLERIPLYLNGETRLADITIFPLVETEGAGGAVIRVDDVTERVRMEEAMIQSEKMVSLGGLAAGMAHEINNPLAGVLNSLAVVQKRLETGSSRNREIAGQCDTTIEAVRAYMEARGLLSMLDSAGESGQRIAELVDNVMSFSRKGDRAFAAHDLAVLLDKTLDIVSRNYDPQGAGDFRRIEIARDYHPGAPPAWCEAGKVQQVFFNLLVNGAQAMAQHHNGESPRFDLRVQPDADMVRVEIEDNGPGMDEETRRRVFEPFFTTKVVGAGSGLGLSLSYFIVTENHCGSMTAESTPGKGTRFIIQLPVEGGGS
jgi:PAS domain S-box-containing protein